MSMAAKTTKQAKRETFEELERLAHRTDDMRPMSPAMRRQWEAARRAGAKPVGRPRKDPQHRSRIVPISIAPDLLAEVDRFAKAAGISRSRLVAEGLRLRLK
jgi:hypothetical protein